MPSLRTSIGDTYRGYRVSTARLQLIDWLSSGHKLLNTFSDARDMILQRPHHSTSLICYFSSGKRWEKAKVPNTGSYVSVTTKVVGRTTKENHLAVRILDMSYIPKSFSTPVSSPASTQSISSKQSNRWSGCVESVTPSKKIRYSNTACN